VARNINWIALRTAYIVKGWSAQKCADEFGLHPTTVKTRAAREGWAKERDRNMTDATAAATAEAREQVAEMAMVVRERHANLVVRLHSLLDGIEEDIAVAKPGRSRAETRRAGMDAFEKAVKIGRLALGITEGQSSVGDGEKTDNRLEITIVEPERDTA
jgi:hypothetical protein